ncbi:hypothetical protein ASE25_05510 [Terrabacter sp. Root85]|nr:hypothetical protein ASE25_05510 [Terrabacter sp. Root85]
MYAIVDGLQRANTIADHLLAPFAEATAQLLPVDQVGKLAAELRALFKRKPPTDEAVSNAIVEWLRTVKKVDRTAFEWSKLVESVCAQLGLPETTKAQDKKLQVHVLELLKQIEARVDIGTYEIPVLIYSGPDGALPEIFERINTQGTILSKYEIFAAAWVGMKVRVADKEIRAAIDGRYAKLESEGYTVDRSQVANEASLFEYLFGLSQVLGKKFPRLFSASAAEASKSSSAFPLVALVLGLRLEDMDEIPSQLEKDGRGRYKLDAVTECILKAAKLVDETLAPFLALSLTKESSALAHGELQIVSMVAAAAAHGYDRASNYSRRPGAAAKEQKLRAAFPQHYLIDIMRQTWRGPLYTYAYERVWDSTGAPSDHYASVHSKEEWSNAMGVWLTEQLSEAATKRPNVSSSDKVILKFLYSKKISVHDQAKNQYDVEHLIPVDRVLKMTLGAGQTGWPLGALGNLALLERSVNRKKQSETIDEYFNRTSRAPSSAEQTEIEALLFCAAADTAIPKVNGKDSMTDAQYRALVKKRWTRMQAQLAKNLEIIP